VGAGAASAATAAGLEISAHRMADSAHPVSGIDAQRQGQRIEARNRAALYTGAAGLVAAGVGLALYYWWGRP
jgi:hypothetical protein